MFEAFHFIHPLWLWALVPSALILWQLLLTPGGNNPWSHVIDKQLLPILLSSGAGKQSRLSIWLVAIAWSIAIVALANPTWEQKPTPIFQTTTSRVIVLDLSTSMFSTDISPSRFSRARFKVEDILNEPSEAQTGLIVFAGSAFTVAPLTRDAETIRALLRALDPRIMPTQGSRADLGLEKAENLLAQAGVAHGEILLISDGFSLAKTRKVALRLQQNGHRLSILGAATKAGADLKLPKGNFVKDRNGNIVRTQLDETAMKTVAQAGGGIYSPLTSSDKDIRLLLGQSIGEVDDSQQQDPTTRAQWKEQGPVLVLFLLPLAALAFRRGWLLSICLVTPLLFPYQPALAIDWIDLWQRNDQQSAKAMLKKDYESASELASTPSQKGSALFRAGKYNEAAEAFSQSNNAVANYNLGNALAKQGQYKEAIKAWDSALKQQPDMEDAITNKATVEKILQQQEKQSQKNKDEDNKDQEGKENEQQQKGDKGKDGAKQQSGKSGEQDKDGEQTPGDEDKQGDGKNSDNQFSDAADKLKQQQEKASAEKNDTSEEEKKEAQQEGQQQTAEKSDESSQNNKNRQLTEAEILSSEEQMAAEQWLRRIPDDPGGLLRRKFRYQYQRQKDRQEEAQPW